ncbi:MAG: heavy metal translocating P-type ATPase metal-binding domain-containing protein [Kofleriaceae bacterium]
MTAVATRSGTCAHCGLPSAATFCCTGCEIVHGAIAQLGLDKFYALRETSAPAKTTSQSYVELDDAAFQRLNVTEREGACTAALYLEDLRCTACVWLVEATPRVIPGVRELRVDLGRSRCDVVWDPSTTKLSTIAHHLDRIGHTVHPYRGVDREASRRREDRSLLIRLGIAGAAMGNLMLLAIALYAGASDPTFFRWCSMIVAVPALGYAATPMFKTALGALRSRRLHLDLPLSIGIIAGLVTGAINTIRGSGEIYFDSLSMLVFLLLVARFVVLKHQRRASSAAEMLLALTPSRARRIVDGVVTEVSIEAVAQGDRLIVRPNETIPIDGVIVEGTSAIDAGLLTGESRPVDVHPGDLVHAGTLNASRELVIEATAVGEATRIGALVAKISELSLRRSQIERFVDRVAGRFVAIVTITAAVLAVVRGVQPAMALLIVTCPCALALATPLAVTVALGRAARRGILIKGADALERLATPGTMYLDKTGTLTEGRQVIATWIGDPTVRPLAAALEAHSGHPIARAFDAASPALLVTDIVEELGRGISGTITQRLATGISHHVIMIGSPRWLREHCTCPIELDAWLHEIIGRAQTPIAIARDHEIVALVGIADPIRADARTSLDHLKQRDWTLGILSGDDARVVAAVARELDLDPALCDGGLSPEAKLVRIENVRSEGHRVVMVGDRVNDAAAIAAATCGIAVSGAAEIAIEAADIYMRSPDISTIAATVDGASATLATIRRSLRFSLAYNTVAGTLAITGVINPLLAAVLMPASSLTVLVSSLRSRAFRKETR